MPSGSIKDTDKLMEEHVISADSIKKMHLLQWVLLISLFSIIITGVFFIQFNYDFLVEPSEDSLSISKEYIAFSHQDNTPIQEESFQITNDGSSEYTITITDVPPHASIETQTFDLKPGQNKIVVLRMKTADFSPGIHFETVGVFNGNSKVKIPIIIEKQHEGATAKLDLSTPDITTVRTTGSVESISLKLFDFPIEEDKKIEVQFAISDLDGSIIAKEKEEIASEQTTVFKSITLPEIDKKTYAVSATATIDDITSSALYFFTADGITTASTSFLSVYGDLPFFYAFSISLTLFLLLLVTYLYLYFSAHAYHFIVGKEVFEEHLKKVKKPVLDDTEIETKTDERRNEKIVRKVNNFISRAEKFLSQGKLHKAEKMYDKLMYAYVELSFEQKKIVHKKINTFHSVLSKAIQKRDSEEEVQNSKELKAHQKKAKEFQKKEKEKVAEQQEHALLGFISNLFKRKDLKNEDSKDEDSEEEIDQQIKDLRKEEESTLADELAELEKEISTRQNLAEDELHDHSAKTSFFSFFKKNKKIEEIVSDDREKEEEEIKEHKEKTQDKVKQKKEKKVKKSKKKQSKAKVRSIRKDKSKAFIKCHEALIKGWEFLDLDDIEQARKYYKKSFSFYLDLEYHEKTEVYKELNDLYKNLT